MDRDGLDHLAKPNERHYGQFRHFRYKSRGIFVKTTHSIFFLSSLRPSLYILPPSFASSPRPPSLTTAVLISDHHHRVVPSICSDLELAALTALTTSSSHSAAGDLFTTIILINNEPRRPFDPSNSGDVAPPTISSLLPYPTTIFSVSGLTLILRCGSVSGHRREIYGEIEL
ncbi:hypothetical protein MTR_3g452580 [Medicago truncatula]|uniref:Uncharacterized protein n=1 Tax=Medicago truncatula TaxID=3880 RepID=A0A072UVZ3_MEDTR|nr:hypothetical protein MTR_3g452580 [Medicago truncatula]